MGNSAAISGRALSVGNSRVTSRIISSLGGVGTPVVVSGGPTVAGVGIAASVLSVLCGTSVVLGIGVVVSTIVGIVVSLLDSGIVVVDISLLTVVSSVPKVVAAVVVVTVEASVLPP